MAANRPSFSYASALRLPTNPPPVQAAPAPTPTPPPSQTSRLTPENSLDGSANGVMKLKGHSDARVNKESSDGAVQFSPSVVNKMQKTAPSAQANGQRVVFGSVVPGTNPKSSALLDSPVVDPADQKHGAVHIHQPKFHESRLARSYLNGANGNGNSNGSRLGGMIGHVSFGGDISAADDKSKGQKATQASVPASVRAETLPRIHSAPPKVERVDEGKVTRPAPVATVVPDDHQVVPAGELSDVAGSIDVSVPLETVVHTVPASQPAAATPAAQTTEPSESSSATQVTLSQPASAFRVTPQPPSQLVVHSGLSLSPSPHPTQQHPLPPAPPAQSQPPTGPLAAQSHTFVGGSNLPQPNAGFLVPGARPYAAARPAPAPVPGVQAYTTPYQPGKQGKIPAYQHQQAQPVLVPQTMGPGLQPIQMGAPWQAYPMAEYNPYQPYYPYQQTYSYMAPPMMTQGGYTVRPGAQPPTALPGAGAGASNIPRVNVTSAPVPAVPGTSAALPGAPVAVTSVPIMSGIPGGSTISVGRPVLPTSQSRRIQIKDPNTGKEVDLTKIESSDEKSASVTSASVNVGRPATSPSPQPQQAPVAGVTVASAVAPSSTGILPPPKSKAIPIRHPDDVKKEKEEKERKDREEKERLEKERGEKERAEKEQEVKERQLKEQEETERLKKEREEQERLEREEQDRIAKEQVKKEQLEREEEERKQRADEARLEAEKVEQERLAKQKSEEEKLRQEQEAAAKLQEQCEKEDAALAESLAVKEAADATPDGKAILAADEDSSMVPRPKTFKVGDDGDDDTADGAKESEDATLVSKEVDEDAKRGISPEAEADEDSRERYTREELEEGEIADEQEDEAEEKEDRPPRPLVKISPSDFGKVAYPSGVTAPEVVAGIPKYSREFLRLFQAVCTVRPEGLATKEEIFEDKKAGSSPARGGSASGPRSLDRRPPSSTNIVGRSATLPRMPSGSDVSLSRSSTLPPKSSEDRFLQRKATGFGVGVPGVILGINAPAGRPGVFVPGPPMRSNSGVGLPSISRTPSSGPMRPGPPGGRGGRGGGMGPRTGSRRGGNVDEAQFTIPVDQIKPLESTEAAWLPGTLKRKPTAAELDQEAKEKLRLEELGKKIQGLLNKLTMDNFDAISLQILGMPVTGPDQLEIVVEKIFDKAVDEPNFAALYSKLCAKLTKELPEKQPWIIGDDKHNAFRRFILNKNQKEYEAGNKWSEMGKNRVKKDVSEMTQEEKDTIIAEEELKAKLKRRTLGNVVFIGELFKLGLLTEKIMHTCILGLLRDVHDALKSASGNKITVEEELETLIKLLTTAGQKLDHQKAADHIDSYFKEMSNLSKNELITSRIRFGLLDLIDLRRNKWVSRRQVTGPKTIAEIRAEAAAQQEQANLRAQGRTPSGRGPPMARESSQRGMGGREHSQRGVMEDRPVTIYNRGQQVSKQTGDLSGFGKLGSESRKPTEVRLGPGGGAFGAGSKGWRDGDDSDRRSIPMSRTGSQGGASIATPVSNKFSALDDILEPKKDEPKEDTRDEKEDAKETEKPAEGPKKLTEDQLESRADNLNREILNGDVDGQAAVEAWEEFKFNKFEGKALESMINKVVEAKEAQITRAADVIVHVVSNTENVLDQKVVMEVIREYTGILEDLAIDVPQVYSTFGTFIARLVAGGAASPSIFADVSSTLLELSPKFPVAPKLIKDAFATLKKIDEDEVSRVWSESGLELESFWPSSTKPEEIGRWVDLNNFSFMRSASTNTPSEANDAAAPGNEEPTTTSSDSGGSGPALERLSAGLVERLGSDTDAGIVSEWLESDFTLEDTSSPAFIHTLVTAFLRHVASRTFLPDGTTEPIPATTEMYNAQKEVFERYRTTLVKVLPEDRKDLRLEVLFAAQAYCAGLGFPSSFLDHVFRILVDSEILDDQTYRDWRDDTTRETGSKREALNQVPFLRSLELE